jgi:hypothetical protein
MVEGVKIMDDALYCMSCGTCNGEFKIIKYHRVCSLCRYGVLFTVNEVIDMVNDLQIQGLLPENFFSDRTEQTYNREELDFDDDLLSVEQAISREDAMRDMYDIDEEY